MARPDFSLLELFVTMPGKPTWTSDVNIVGHMVQHRALVDARALKAAYWESKFS